MLRRFNNVFKIIVASIAIPLIFGNVFCITWTGGALKPPNVNTYYYPGKLEIFPTIKVYGDSIEIGSYDIKVEPLDSNNNVTVYIDSLTPDKVFRIKVENPGTVYFSLCGLGKGPYKLYIDDTEQSISYSSCIKFTKRFNDDVEHTIKIEYVKAVEVPTRKFNIGDLLPYILGGVLAILAIIYLKL